MKNKILKVVTAINAMAFIISVMMIDSDSTIPAIISFTTLIYLAIFAAANTDKLNEEGE